MLVSVCIIRHWNIAEKRIVFLTNLSPMNNGIYKIENLISGSLYVGSAAGKTRINRRWEAHKYHLRRGTHHSSILQNSWNKYGENEFRFIVIEYCLPKECIAREQYWMNFLTPKYNISPIAGNRLGTKNTEESRARMRIAQKGKVAWNKGLKTPQEVIEKNRKAHIGKKMSIESRRKMSITKMGILNPKSKKVA